MSFLDPQQVEFRIELPVPPSDNAYVNPIKGRLVKSSLHRKYAKHVQSECLIKGLRYGNPLFPTQDIYLSIIWYRSKKMGDTLNRWKVLCDALQGFIYNDDKQISTVFIKRFEANSDSVIVSVSEAFGPMLSIREAQPNGKG